MLIGDAYQAMATWRALFDLGLFTHPIIPPAVSAHACRIRVSMSAEHTSEQIDRVLDAFEKIAQSPPTLASRPSERGSPTTQEAEVPR